MFSLGEHVTRIVRGEPVLGRAFLRDMLLHGTLLNFVTSGLSLAAYGLGAPGLLAITVFLLPLPYNLLLCRSVIRAADREGGLLGVLASIAAPLWVMAVTFI